MTGYCQDKPPPIALSHAGKAADPMGAKDSSMDTVYFLAAIGPADLRNGLVIYRRPECLPPWDYWIIKQNIPMSLVYCGKYCGLPGDEAPDSGNAPPAPMTAPKFAWARIFVIHDVINPGLDAFT
jgi:hypothetical protein